MFPRIVSSTARSLSCFSSRPRFTAKCAKKSMGVEIFSSEDRRRAEFRLCNISSGTTEVLEIRSENPSLHVLLVPGNPGVITFYKDFVEYLFELLEGSASITAIGHISHTKKDWEHGRLFSLQKQIDHKVDFIREELQNIEIPLMLVGHSIGSHISIEMFKRLPEVAYCIGLYPFLKLNRESRRQTIIEKIAGSSMLSVATSFSIASLGLLPIWALRFVVQKCFGKSWSTNAVEAACSHLSKYHTIRNVLFMTMTEFRKLSEEPDWAFMRERKAQLAFLFGVDDHWGPIHMLEEISKQVPDIAISIEREGHTHSFSCSEAGSLWVAQHAASLIKNQMACSNK